MLEPRPIFQPYQFVQKIEFKNKDINRHDLGLDYFGFIKKSHIIERTIIEYDVIFAGALENQVLEYSLRSLSEKEVQDRLKNIMANQEKYQVFIEALSLEHPLKKSHLDLLSLSTASQPALLSLE